MENKDDRNTKGTQPRKTDKIGKGLYTWDSVTFHRVVKPKLIEHMKSSDLDGLKKVGGNPDFEIDRYGNVTPKSTSGGQRQAKTFCLRDVKGLDSKEGVATEVAAQNVPRMPTDGDEEQDSVNCS